MYAEGRILTGSTRSGPRLRIPQSSSFNIKGRVKGIAPLDKEELNSLPSITQDCRQGGNSLTRKLNYLALFSEESGK